MYGNQELIIFLQCMETRNWWTGLLILSDFPAVLHVAIILNVQTHLAQPNRTN